MNARFRKYRNSISAGQGGRTGCLLRLDQHVSTIDHAHLRGTVSEGPP